MVDRVAFSWCARTRSASISAIFLIALITGCGGSEPPSDVTPAAPDVPGSYGPTTGSGGPRAPAPDDPHDEEDPVKQTKPSSREDAFRFLNRATFGATEAELGALMQLGYDRWIQKQLTLPASRQLPTLQAAQFDRPPNLDVNTHLQSVRRSVWLTHSVQAPDQLRQRVAFALSQIFVVSDSSVLSVMPLALADYYDMLASHAFGNFRDLLEAVTLHPAMGVYLSMLGNQKTDPERNIRPDENYAREALQLFSTGLVWLELDGTVRRGPDGKPIPVFDQSVIEGFAKVYTGWSWSGATEFGAASRTLTNQILPMQVYPEEHDPGFKVVLSYPGALLTEIPPNQSPEKDLKDALDNIFHHPNVGPFICKQLIQRLVTSNPSPEYVERVARVFNDDGMGVRGNLAAVVTSILLDSEAREAATTPQSTKLKEPLLRYTELLRAYAATSQSGKLRLNDPVNVFGQGPLQAPSVFNFFSPSYAPPGEISDQGLVAPELEIATEYWNAQVTDWFFNQAFCWSSAPVGDCPLLPDEVRRDIPFIDVREEVALAATPQALVARVAEKLLGGEVSPALDAEVRRVAEVIPVESAPERVAEVIYLVSSSPEFAVLR